MINANELINVDNREAASKAIMKEAKRIAGNAAKLGHALHICLLSAVSHAMAHGDTRIIDQVFATVDQSQARGKIVTWLTGLSNLVKKTDKAGNVIFRKPEDKPLTVAFDAMCEKTPWSYSVDPQETEFDFDKKLLQLLDTASKKVKKGDKIKGGAAILSPKLAAIEAFLKSQTTPTAATPAN